MTSWKTTVSGILSFIMATAGVLTAFAAAQAASNPAQSKLYLGIVTGCTLASGLGKAWIGLLSKDADKITTPDIVKANAAAADASKPTPPEAPHA